jgi:fibronectin-binding autotransporter adhesin
MRSAIRLFALFFVTLSLGMLISQAQTAVNWNGGNGNWSTATDWSGGVVPNNGGGKTYNVTIPSIPKNTSETLTLDLGVTVNDLTLMGSISDVTAPVLQSSGNNSLTIAAGGTLTNSGTINFNTGSNVLTILSGGTLNNSGTINIAGTGTGLNVTGTTINNAGGAINLESGSKSTVTGNVTNSGVFATGGSGNNSVNVTGTFTNNGATMTAPAATLQLGASGDVLNVNALSNSGVLTLVAGSTLTITGGGNGVTDVVAGSTYNISGTFNVKNGGTTTNALAKLTSVEGSLSVDNAQTAMTMTPTGGTLIVAKGGAFEVGAGSTVNLTGNVSNSGTFTTGFDGGSGTVNVSGTFTNNLGAQLNMDHSGDVLNVNALVNSGTAGSPAVIILSTGTTLNITGGGNGVTDVALGSTYNLSGAFNVKNGGTTTNALAKLTSVEGSLSLDNAQTAMTMTPMGGTLTIAKGGAFEVGAGSTVNLTGNVSNSGIFTTGFDGGSGTVNVSGTFTNNAGAQLNMDHSGDVLNVNALNNSGTLNLATGTTLTITGGGNGVTDVVAGSNYVISGTFNVKNGGTTTSALAKLTSVEGSVDLANGQTIAMTPLGGTLTIASGGTLRVDAGTAVSLTGNVNNSGSFTTGFGAGKNTVNISGSFTNNAGGALNVDGAGGPDVVNVTSLTNLGAVSTNAGTTLTVTGGGNGVTDVVAGSSYTIGGAFNVKNGGTTTSALAKVTSIEGSLTLQNGQTSTITPTGGTLTLSNTGTFVLTGATPLTLSGNLSNAGNFRVEGVSALALTGNVTNSGIFTTGFNGGSGTVNVSGTFTNNSGAQLNIDGAGDVVNIPTLSNAGTISFAPSTLGNATLSVTGASTSFTNSGTINLTAGTLKFNASTLSLTGGGTVNLGNSNGTETYALQVGAGDTGTLTNVNNTIAGFGNLGNGTLHLVNQGTITANAGGTPTEPSLTIQQAGALTNTGTMQAINEGTLILQGTINNTGGTIAALGTPGGAASSTVQLLGGSVINGGTLTTTTVSGNSGIIEGTGAVTLNGIANSGTYAVNPGTTTTLDGIINNTGSITLTGSTLTLGNSVTLNGKGTVVLSNSASNLINAATSGPTLTNANTIEGAGTIQGMGIVNTGTLAANQSTPLIILPSSAGLNNKGTLSVSTGDTMQIGTSAGGALINFSGTTLTGGTYAVSGTLEFGASGTSLVTNAANITLTGAGAKIVNFGGQNVPTNFATNAPNGSFSLAGGANFTTAGNFTNNGKLAAGAGTKFTVTGSLTNFNSATNTLTGGTYMVGGKLNFAGANIVTDAANITLQGAGEIVNSTNSANGLANLATIASNGSFGLATGAKFTTAGNLTNNGGLSVANGTTLTVTGNLTNLSSGTLSGGSYTVGGTMQLSSGNGGITKNAANLTLTGGAFKIQDGTSNALANFGNNTGTLTLNGNANFTTGASNFSNSGGVNVTKGSTMTVGGNNIYNQTAGTTTVDGTLAASAINVTGGSVLGAGKLASNVTVGGGGTTPTINVGDSSKAGLLAITGAYSQLSTGTMNVSIGGTTVGTKFSQLQVSGTASLGGTLTAALVNGFAATVGQAFTVLTASSVTGTFANSTIAINGSEHFVVSYTSNSVVLTVASGASSKTSTTAAAGSQLAIASAKVAKLPVVISDLRHRIGGHPKVARPVWVAGLQPVPRPGGALSGLIIGGGENIRMSHVAPVLSAWERVPLQAHHESRITGFRTMSENPSASNNWVGRNEMRMPSVSSLAPYVSTIRPVMPVRIPMHPMMRAIH